MSARKVRTELAFKGISAVLELGGSKYQPVTPLTPGSHLKQQEAMTEELRSIYRPVPVPPRAVTPVKKGEAARLARKFGLHLSDVQEVLCEFAAEERESAHPVEDRDAFERTVARLLGGRPMDAVLDNGWHAMSHDRTAPLDPFFDWLRANMFAISSPTKTIAARQGVSPVVLDKVRKALQLEGSEVFDRAQFEAMLRKLLGSKGEGDLSARRLDRLWAEVDVEGNGRVSFEQFCRACVWYVDCFDPVITEKLSAFYATFAPPAASCAG